MVAMSILPVDRTTLVYGSADGGRTVMNSDPQAAATMQNVRLPTYSLARAEVSHLYVCLYVFICV